MLDRTSCEDSSICAVISSSSHLDTQKVPQAHLGYVVADKLIVHQVRVIDVGGTGLVCCVGLERCQ